MARLTCAHCGVTLDIDEDQVTDGRSVSVIEEAHKHDWRMSRGRWYCCAAHARADAPRKSA